MHYKPATGTLSTWRRGAICRSYIGNRGRTDERLTHNWAYTKTGREPHSFTLKMPDGLSCIIEKEGRFCSYRDYDGIAQDMTQDLAVKFDTYLVEITGITSNRELTN